MTYEMSHICHVCNANSLKNVSGFSAFSRVTSDTKPWHRGGELAVCMSCGVTQKPITEKWMAEAEAIYKDYTLYHQSDGADQMVFDAAGSGRDKNAVIVERFLAASRQPVASAGRLLDFGCGRGAFLGAFAAVRPEWDLVGYDTNESVGPDIEKIPNARFESGCLNTLPDRPFDVVSLCHVLEHLPAPLDLLTSLAPHLSQSGFLLIQVPDLTNNPYDLFVADHCTHFHVDDLGHLLNGAGYEIVLAATDWINKEISVVARRAESLASVKDNKPHSENSRFQELSNRLASLNCMSEKAQSLTAGGTAGIFGTAVAGIWLDQQTNQTSAFFVDEDPGRIGKTFLGRPVIHPRDIPVGAEVLVPFPRPLAETIVSRIVRSSFRCHILSPN